MGKFPSNIPDPIKQIAAYIPLGIIYPENFQHKVLSRGFYASFFSALWLITGNSLINTLNASTEIIHTDSQ